MFEQHQNEYTISTDPARLNVDAIVGALSQTYWAKGRSRQLIERSLQHSLCFGMYHDDQQIGFARVITDYATFGYLADVYVLEHYRGSGLGKWLIATIIAHPDLANLRRMLLVTRDAHGLYKQYGFSSLERPERWMEIFRES